MGSGKSPRMSAKDLVGIGIFGAIYVVIYMLGGLAGALAGPIVMLIALPISVFVGGTVIMVMLHRIPHAGPLLVLGVVLGVVMLATGHPWFVLPIYVVSALIGEGCMALGRYRSAVMNALAYTAFSLSIAGPFIPLLLLSHSSQAHQLTARGGQPNHGLEAIINPTTFTVFMIVILVAAFLGGIVGTRLIKRHFARAGVA